MLSMAKEIWAPGRSAMTMSNRPQASPRPASRASGGVSGVRWIWKWGSSTPVSMRIRASEATVRPRAAVRMEKLFFLA